MKRAEQLFRIVRGRIRKFPPRQAAKLRMLLPKRAPAPPVREVPVIVTLTSFPPRMKSVWLVVESVLRQDVPADRVVLVLSEDEFPDRQLPRRVRRQQKRGLEIMWVEGNARSYKKFLPVAAENPDAIVVTVDDDAIYASDLLSRLLAEHEQRPEAVIGTRGWCIKFDGGRLLPYASWELADSRTPEDRVLLTGVGGILYPPRSLSDRVFDYDTARALCPSADDLWFWAMARQAGTPVRCIGGRRPSYTLLVSSRTGALSAENHRRGENDVQLARLMGAFGELSS